MVNLKGIACLAKTVAQVVNKLDNPFFVQTCAVC